MEHGGQGLNPSQRQIGFSDNVLAFGHAGNNTTASTNAQKYSDTYGALSYNNKNSKSRTNRRNNLELPNGNLSAIQNMTADGVTTGLGGRIIVGPNSLGAAANPSTQFSGSKQAPQFNANPASYSLDSDVQQQ